MEKLNIIQEEAEWIKSFDLIEPKSFSQFLMDKANKDLVNKRNYALKLKVIEHLSLLGYNFVSDAEFECFCQSRITLVQIDEFIKELYLDFVSENERGIFLIRYSDEITLDTSEIDNYKISMDIKMSIG